MKAYNTDNVAGFCLPSVQSNLKKVANAFKQTGRIESIYQSLKTTKNLIWASIAFSFIFSYFFSWLLEKCAGVVVTVSIIGFYLGAGYMGYISFTNYKHY